MQTLEPVKLCLAPTDIGWDLCMKCFIVLNITKDCPALSQYDLYDGHVCNIG